MSRDVDVIVTVNESGDFMLTGDFSPMELLVACTGLSKTIAEILEKTEVEILKAILKIAIDEEQYKQVNK